MLFTDNLSFNLLLQEGREENNQKLKETIHQHNNKSHRVAKFLL